MAGDCHGEKLEQLAAAFLESKEHKTVAVAALLSAAEDLGPAATNAAAERGSWEASYRYGILLADGQHGVEKDQAGAIVHLQKALDMLPAGADPDCRCMVSDIVAADPSARWTDSQLF